MKKRKIELLKLFLYGLVFSSLIGCWVKEVTKTSEGSIVQKHRTNVTKQIKREKYRVYEQGVLVEKGRVVSNIGNSWEKPIRWRILYYDSTGVKIDKDVGNER